jgi:hypothetical protein
MVAIDESASKTKLFAKPAVEIEHKNGNKKTSIRMTSCSTPVELSQRTHHCPQSKF